MSSSPNCLYVTLQYLRKDNMGNNRYHWGLYASDDKPPEGILFHATDMNRAPLDLYYEERRVRNPMRSESLIVCLRIGDAPSPFNISRCVKAVPLMSSSHLPRGEARWTCRVWVKQALLYLHYAGLISLKADVDRIEQQCLDAANKYLPFRSQGLEVKVYNDERWMSATTSSRTAPMEIDSTGHASSSRRTPSTADAMDVDATGHYGTKPMVVDPPYRSSGYPRYTN